MKEEVKSPKPTSASNLISYVVQRHGQLTLACESFEKFGVPMRRFSSHTEDVDVSAEDVFRNHQLMTATNIDPEIVEWFGMHARACLAECRFLATTESAQSLHTIEVLIQRDLESINKSREIYDSLPESVQAIIRVNGAKRLDNFLALDAARALVALSGTFLYAWQNEWYEALKIINSVFGGVDLPEMSAMSAIDKRLGDVEADLYGIRRQMAVASAVLQPPPPPDQDNQE